jgi:predicted RecA/RadA family phage recombinase
MKNYVQLGDTLTMPSPADVTSGAVVIVGALIGIASGDALSGADLDLVTRGVFTVPKVNAQAIGLGAVVYYDSTTKLATTTASGNTRLGIATAAAANPSASVNVKLG